MMFFIWTNSDPSQWLRKMRCFLLKVQRSLQMHVASSESLTRTSVGKTCDKCWSSSSTSDDSSFEEVSVRCFALVVLVAFSVRFARSHSCYQLQSLSCSNLFFSSRCLYHLSYLRNDGQMKPIPAMRSYPLAFVFGILNDAKWPQSRQRLWLAVPVLHGVNLYSLPSDLFERGVVNKAVWLDRCHSNSWSVPTEAARHTWVMDHKKQCRRQKRRPQCCRQLFLQWSPESAIMSRVSVIL